MTVLLRVDASARLDRSITRQLTERFIDGWRSSEPDVQVLTRDVGRNPPSIVTEAWISAGFLSPEQRTQKMKDALAESMTLIGEVRRADVIVIGSPLYNYGLPGALKAWIDQIIRIGETFSFDLERGDFPIQSTLSGKSLVVLSSRGEFGFEPGGIRYGWNHMSPHLRTIATRLLGIAGTDIHEIASEYQEFNDERHQRSRDQALRDAAELGSRLATHMV
ncbi:MAG: NAD(P)H-dependent oxidoreductase [Phycisphaerales bacterium]|nr:NAD(P)H-dependent oxidoreductase [Phycisphaerales bacterium]